MKWDQKRDSINLFLGLFDNLITQHNHLHHSLVSSSLSNLSLGPGFEPISIVLRVLRLKVSVHNVYITKQFQTTFAQGEGGAKNPLVEVIVNSKEENF